MRGRGCLENAVVVSGVRDFGQGNTVISFEGLELVLCLNLRLHVHLGRSLSYVALQRHYLWAKETFPHEAYKS